MAPDTPKPVGQMYVLTGSRDIENMIIYNMGLQSIIAYALTCRAAKDLVYGHKIYFYMKALVNMSQELSEVTICQCRDIDILCWYYSNYPRAKKLPFALIKTIIKANNTLALDYLAQVYARDKAWYKPTTAARSIELASRTGKVEMVRHMCARYGGRLLTNFARPIRVNYMGLTPEIMESYFTNGICITYNHWLMRKLLKSANLPVLKWWFARGPAITACLSFDMYRSRYNNLDVVKWALTSDYQVYIKLSSMTNIIKNYLASDEVRNMPGVTVEAHSIYKEGIKGNINSINVKKYAYFDTSGRGFISYDSPIGLFSPVIAIPL